jgi:hypothetical protein
VALSFERLRRASFVTFDYTILLLSCMFACPSNLTPSFLTICKIIRFKVVEKVVFPMLEGTIQFWRPKKPSFLVYMDCRNSYSCLRWVTYTSTKSHTYYWCETLQKKLFSTRGLAKIHIQRPFFDNKIGMSKLFYWNTNSEHMFLVLPWHREEEEKRWP